MLDHIDAFTAIYREMVARNQDVKWTEYSNFLESNVYIPDKLPK
jgi:hypothetical protein